jgi:hypothetical protein
VGTDNPGYSIGTTISAQNGNRYRVHIKSVSTCGNTITSAVVVLTINEQPEITIQPVASRTVCENTSVTFTVNPGVTTNPTYQWRKAGVNISGANSASYTIPVVAVSHAGNYDVVVGGTCTPGIPSNISVLNVNKIPVGTAVPAGTHFVCSGTALNITPVTDVLGTSFTWSGSNGSGGSGVINDTPVNANNNPTNVTYTVIPTGPTTTNCVGSPFTIVVTVNPNPSFTVTNITPTQCSGETTNITFTSPTVGHRINVVSVNYNGAGNSATITGRHNFLYKWNDAG